MENPKSEVGFKGEDRSGEGRFYLERARKVVP